MKRAEHIAAFVTEIWKWYEKNKRDLPWRDLQVKDDTQRAYMILVSEVMLQQTQVSRVIVIFKRFLEQFPRMQDLASASNKEVILAWRGMGYNSRALRLRDAAKTVVEDFDGVFPREMEELLSINGIGHYTAAAIRNFAFGIETACLDTNIRRVLHRTFIGAENPDGSFQKNDVYLLKLAEEVLGEALDSSRSSADWHAALMDFGSLICTKMNPKWDECPLTKKGLMKAAYKVKLQKGRGQKRIRKEPGRFVGSTYIPNRIFRGKIVEELRDSSSGLRLPELGRRVCIDWDADQHKTWMSTLLQKLQADDLVEKRSGKYLLKA